MKRSELFFTALLLPVDAIMIVLAFVAAYHLRYNTGNITAFWEFGQYFRFVVTLLPLWLVVFAGAGLYSIKRNYTSVESLGKLLAAVAGGTFLVIAWPFLTRQEFFSRLVVVYIFIFAFIFVLLGRIVIRIIQRFLYRYGIGDYHVILVGTNGTTHDLIQQFSSNANLGRKIVGVIYNRKKPPLANDTILNKYLLGEVESFREILANRYVDEIVITDVNIDNQLLSELIELATERGISVKMTPNILDVYATRIETAELANQPMLTFTRTQLDGWGKIVKRLIDLFLSAIFIIILSPLMLLIALLIKLDSKGPVFFSTLDDGTESMRIGQYGKPFHYFKFRSMKPNTHNMRYNELADLNVREGPLVKIPNDPRVTRVGKWLRKLSLDELPELFLVFMGKMSLVGPRPHLPEEVARYQKHHRRVLTVKPGMTGLAQISGRSDLNFEDEVRIDTYYIENWSLLLDLQIILKTPMVLITSRNRKAE